jgi:hypothetical protein
MRNFEDETWPAQQREAADERKARRIAANIAKCHTF